MKEFILGANYWASHAGTEMWRNWDEEQVDKDLSILKENGIKYLRVFPNWRDFQPVMPVYGGNGILREYLLTDCRIPENPYFLEEVMLERFEKFCEIAEKYDMKLIVGILTGWMSGRLFIPEALDGRNLYTDPLALTMEHKFISGFVGRLKNQKSIYAWNLGNECNCLSINHDRYVGYAWSATVVSAIKAADPTRMVISGMHSIRVRNTGWLIEDQGECTDMLTTHPYPFFVPHVKVDPIASLRSLYHATAETKLYADVGGKPCMVEEVGTLSYNICDDEISADFMRLNLLSNWAHGSPGLMWWGAHEQLGLTTPPYKWNMLERELGMLDMNMQPKPYLTEMKNFGKWLATLDFNIEAPKSDATILLTESQDDYWGTAFMSFILCKQAGVVPTFLAPNKDIPDSKVYIMPTTNGQGPLYEPYWVQLLEKVEAGATLFVSNDNGFFVELEKVFGTSVRDSEHLTHGGKFTLNGKEIDYKMERYRHLVPTTAEVLANDENGEPIFTVNKFGKGKIYYLNFPLEKIIVDKNMAFEGNNYLVYKEVLKDVIAEMPVSVADNHIGITKNGNVITLINYSGETVKTGLQLSGVEVDKIYRGNLEEIPACEGVVFSIK